jgi:pimeloyl-ACP methyl ester carboxylesterase
MTPHEPPGRLIDIGGHALHLMCAGRGSPAVIFDAALGASSLSWSLVLPDVARVTQACAYDRAGMGWSDTGPLPRTAGRIERELHELLVRANVQPPYILVGHSFGGLAAQLFAARHHDETAGLVLIEPALPEDWSEPSESDRKLIDRGVRLCRYGARAARLGIARVVAALASIGALAPAWALAALVSRGALRRRDETILAPMWKLPPEARRPLLHVWTQPRFFEALGSQIESICESAGEVASEGAAVRSDLPIVAISSAAASERRLRADAALASVSSRGRHMVSTTGGHWVPLDDPQTIVDAVVGLVEEIRRRSPA